VARRLSVLKTNLPTEGLDEHSDLSAVASAEVICDIDRDRFLRRGGIFIVGRDRVVVLVEVGTLEANVKLKEEGDTADVVEIEPFRAGGGASAGGKFLKKSAACNFLFVIAKVGWVVDNGD